MRDAVLRGEVVALVAAKTEPRQKCSGRVASSRVRYDYICSCE